MDDLISRQAAIDVAKQHWYKPDIAKALEELPSAEPERKRGGWIKASDADGDYYICSECGEEIPRYTTEPANLDHPYPHKYSIDKTNFCPNCGARME